MKTRIESGVFAAFIPLLHRDRVAAWYGRQIRRGRKSFIVRCAYAYARRHPSFL